jgi:hypothetical protein
MKPFLYFYATPTFNFILTLELVTQIVWWCWVGKPILLLCFEPNQAYGLEMRPGPSQAIGQDIKGRRRKLWIISVILVSLSHSPS